MRKEVSELSGSRCPFGQPMRDKHFLFAPSYTPLNHGSYGTYPKCVQKRLHEVQALAEARPDLFVRDQYPKLLDESRAALAQYLGVPVDEVVFVPNATTGANVVLRSLTFEKGDVILHLSSVYGSIQKTVEYLRETSEIDTIIIEVDYPISDEALVSRFHAAIRSAKAEGKNIRVASFDTVSSMPGLRVPWERLVDVCKAEGVLSMVDGAHGVGQISLNLARVQPDFFTSNCHKWLYVPRGCAVFYVPKRNQHLVRSSLPTSNGFKPLPRGTEKEITNPFTTASNAKSDFEVLFESIATLDVSPYLCISEALRFRREECGGEESIMGYCEGFVSEAGKMGAKILGTSVMQNEEGTLTKCFMINLRLPLTIGSNEGEIPERDTYAVAVWMTSRGAEEYDMFSPVLVHAGKFWTRWSGQIYLDLSDFEKGAKALKVICERVKKGEYLR